LLGTLEDEITKSLLSNLLNQSRIYQQSKEYTVPLDLVTKLLYFALFSAFFTAMIT